MRKGKSIFLDDDTSLGHMMAPPELLKFMDKIAAKLNMSRSGLNRRVMEAFCLYMDEAKTFGKKTFFNTTPTVESWLDERNHISKMSEEVTQLAEQLNSSKTPDEKLSIVSRQNTVLAHMINLMHKSLMT